jgi:hypothetical protein
MPAHALQLDSFLQFFDSKCPSALLCQAVKDCNFDLVRKLVQDGYDISEKDQVRSLSLSLSHTHTFTWMMLSTTHLARTHAFVCLADMSSWRNRMARQRCTGPQRRRTQTSYPIYLLASARPLSGVNGCN